ncbi:hypothetical protein S100390_v1c02850 [Spiroplasma sp. NBRC 100390]|uniref:hypothetical protein n=1 Tax=unclassified Spiroplasma TaxID=2637901 RepID=UPI0008928646|nr:MULTISPECIES: hypothetical protein [unclassified Spiroplasma]AOX43628.1 hypothetical protein STU14_v1c02850 [Spiroplasma sp. TU-14]APE13098.1 hypothetical protein S100390_v1c02850 [Spiroplasma sp. NBRC 100390]
MNKNKPTYGSKFPDLELLDTEEERRKYEEDVKELSKQEQKRFSYVSPTQNNDFSQRRMFWDSPLERVGRSFIVLGQVFAITLAYFIGQKAILIALSNYVDPNIKVFANIYVKDILSYGFLFITLLFSLLYFIPMGMARTAGAVYGWAIAYIMLAILYFLFVEILCATLLILGSIKANTSEPVSQWLLIFIVLVLVITSIWIVGACLLVVKSDDVKRRINLEV